MKKLIFITLVAALAIGISAQALPFGLDFGLSKQMAESKLKENGFKLDKTSGAYMYFVNSKIDNLKVLSVKFDAKEMVDSWEIDYSAKDADAFQDSLEEMLTDKYGEIYDSEGNSPIWKLDNDKGVYLHRYEKGDVNLRISYDVYYDPYEYWWGW